MKTLKGDDIDLMMKKLIKTKGLIIDLRCYPSGMPIYKLGEYLMPEPINFVKFSRNYLSDIGNFYFTDTASIGKKNENYYKGKVVILINEKNQSRAEFHVMAFQVAPNAIVMGSTTSAADGDVSFFWLPGGIHTLFTGIGVYYPDGTETQRIGIIPDIEIKPTIEGLRAGRDEVLEKAIEWIKQK
jgi:C-terminal processing protease CtpA/Prc